MTNEKLCAIIKIIALSATLGFGMIVAFDWFGKQISDAYEIIKKE